MSYIFTKGATSQSIELYIVDSTDGTPETGVTFETAGIDLKYRRKDALVVSITEADLTTPDLEDTWETGGFLEIGNGVYRLDLPDAALASAAGIDRVVVFGTVTGMVVLPVTIHLTAFDLSTASAAQTADNETRLATIETDTNEIQGKLPTNKFMGSSDGADDDGNINSILAGTVTNAAGADVAADIIAVKAETATIVTDTNEIQGKLPTNKFMGSSDGADDDGTLNTIDTVVDAIKVITDALTAAGAAKLALGATTMITGIVSWDNTNATTTVVYSSDIIEATADHFNGRLFVPTSGALLGQYTEITDYALDTGEGKFTVTAMTEPPADNSTFIIL